VPERYKGPGEKFESVGCFSNSFRVEHRPPPAPSCSTVSPLGVVFESEPAGSFIRCPRVELSSAKTPDGGLTKALAYRIQARAVLTLLPRKIDDRRTRSGVPSVWNLRFESITTEINL
jgi:hypothetical protein